MIIPVQLSFEFFTFGVKNWELLVPLTKPWVASENVANCVDELHDAPCSLSGVRRANSPPRVSAARADW
jgi:hypothetical protein